MLRTRALEVTRAGAFTFRHALVAFAIVRMVTINAKSSINRTVQRTIDGVDDTAAELPSQPMLHDGGDKLRHINVGVRVIQSIVLIVINVLVVAGGVDHWPPHYHGGTRLSTSRGRGAGAAGCAGGSR